MAQLSQGAELSSLFLDDRTTTQLHRASLRHHRSFLEELGAAQALNSTALSFLVPHTVAYQSQQICFRSSKDATAPLTEFVEAVGYVFFIKEVYAASESHGVYAVLRRVKTVARAKVTCSRWMCSGC